MSRRGWIVVLAGTGLNLALGLLYAWSVFSKQLVETVERGGYGWTKTAATLPYTVAIACFALMMVPAGRLQDKLGPFWVSMVGSILLTVGFLLSSQTHSLTYLILCFGVLVGIGNGFGYGVSDRLQITLVQDFGVLFHQRTGLAGNEGSTIQQRITRLGVRYGLFRQRPGV